MTDIFVVRGNQSGTLNRNKNALDNISGAGIKNKPGNTLFQKVDAYVLGKTTETPQQ